MLSADAGRSYIVALPSSRAPLARRLALELVGSDSIRTPLVGVTNSKS
jgi:hypothetical protein